MHPNVLTLFSRLQEQTKQAPPLAADEVDHNFPGDILCPRESAVQLPEERYLHGNHLRYTDTGNHYIATQAPWAFPEPFWEACLQERPAILLDLTQPIESSYGASSPHAYPQQEGEALSFGSLHVHCSTVNSYETYSVYHYHLEDKETKNSHDLLRIVFSWENFGGLDALTLLQLVETVDAHHSDRSAPLLVHCRAGVGRTGTFISARECCHLHKQGLFKQDSALPTLEKIILHGRQMRSPHFVEALSQLSTLHQLVMHHLD